MRPSIIFLLFHAASALDIAIEKPDGGNYYRFWFIYAVTSVLMAIILTFSSFVSACHRYKLVASQDDEISEHQW